MKAIEIKDLSKIFTSKTEGVEVIKNISFDVQEGEIVSVVGKSGCGKTTLLRIISSLLKSTSGRVLINGKPAKEVIHEKKLSFMLQRASLFPWLTVYQNVAWPLKLNQKKINAQLRHTAVMKTLRLVGLEGIINYYPRFLSGGEVQRVALARSLITEPSVLLMDEPFSMLDAINRDKLNQEFFNIWRELKPTTLFVTHLITEAVYLSNRVVVLSTPPTRVVDIFNVNLPYPRRQEMLSQSDTLVLLEKIKQAIGE